jgi:hypothetical protein
VTRRFPAVLAMLAAAVAVSACRREDPVAAFLRQIAQAAGRRDAPAIGAKLSDDFQGQGGLSRRGAQAELARDFALYRSVRVEISGLQIERGPGVARARFRARFMGTPRGEAGLAGLLPRESSFDFDVRLVGSGRHWNIAWASWEPAGS